ncbi:MAG: heavy metal translocating P-type ATPase metal-binding domain-containing protein [Verrucomicrobiae bacterium]|nr:heavy metal translocating P-type ATPase metal-binding domain-containing protein [Verrucomicrobiae bacterium]NNJ43233.1 HAD-IC family P-type ATPase [Akkermansiaceae bacterium]
MPDQCIHCETPLEPSQKDSGFCCTGCEFVYQLIHDQGLEKFYDLKRGENSTPLRDQPFQQYDFSWLEESIAKYEADSPDAVTTEFEGSLQGISCIGCVWLVEKLFLRCDGAIRCDIIPTSGSIHLTWSRGHHDPLAFAQDLQRFGYLLGSAKSGSKHTGEFRQLGSRLGICGAFALNAMVFSLPRYLGMPDDFAFAGIFDLITLLSATLAMLVGGSWFIKRAYFGLRAKILHMDTPIALGVSLAYIGSLAGWIWHYDSLMYFDFVAIFIFLMLGGRWIQTAALERNRNRLLEQTPVPLNVKNAHSGESMEIDAIQCGDHYLLPAGQTTPVSSVLAQGSADFSLEWINGEPDPVHRSPGMLIPAGAINLSQGQENLATHLTAEEDWKNSLLAKLLQASEQTSRSPLMEKILRYYLTAVFLLGIGGGLAWSLSGASLATAAQVTISVFVISCPCALGVALPLADELASGRMRTLGVFIRKPAFWSRIRQIKTLFFDKTGTLTMDLPELVDAKQLDEFDDATTAFLAHLCAHSRHPLSRSVMRSLGLRGQRLITQTDSETRIKVHELPGLGTSMTTSSGTIWSLGKCGWDGVTSDPVQATHAGCELRCDGQLVTHFQFQEALRPEAAETLQQLHHLNPHILSGDHNDRVNHIAHLLNIQPDHVHSGLSPDDKAALVRQIDPNHSLFLGDGANDSLAFDAAAITGAVAGRGLLEAKADFYFLSSGLHFIPTMFKLAQKHARAVRTVFAFSLAYNLIAVAVCLAGLMNPLIAAILMPLSSLVSLSLVALKIPTNNRANELFAK